MTRFSRKLLLFITLTSLANVLISGVCYGQIKTPHKKNTYVLSMQIAPLSLMVFTRDKALVKLEMTAVFFIHKSDIPKIEQTVGPNYATQIVPDVVKSEVSTALSLYSSDEIMSARREEIENATVLRCTERLAQYHIQLKDLLFTSILYSPEVQHAYEARLVAAQQREVAKNEAEIAMMKLEAQKKAAKAEAEMNLIISGGLDKKILLLKYIEVLEKLALTPGNHVVVLGEGELDLPKLHEWAVPKKPQQPKKLPN